MTDDAMSLGEKWRRRLKIDPGEEEIVVCDKCLTASCLKGKFLCGDYRIAGTVTKTKRELMDLGLESSDYWED